MPYRPDRPRPAAYLTATPGRGPAPRPVCLSTGRGDTKLSLRECVELAAELLAAVARVDPAAVTIDAMTLPLAWRVVAQSEILQARAYRC